MQDKLAELGPVHPVRLLAFLDSQYADVRYALRDQVCREAAPPAMKVGWQLRGVIERCSTKDPACRYRSAIELGDALKTAEPQGRLWAGVGSSLRKTKSSAS